MIDRARTQRLIAAQQGLLSSTQARSLGFTPEDVRNLKARGRWIVVLNGVYLTEPDLLTGTIARELWWRAALLAHGDDACLVATTGARAFGLVGLPYREAVVEIGLVGGISRHVRFAPSLTRSRDIDVPVIVARQLPLEGDQIVPVGGFPVREIGATLVDAALVVDRATALCLLDSALHLELVTVDELDALAASTKNRRGVKVFREMAVLADGRAESQVESRVRLSCIDGGLPPDDLQYVVRSRDGHPVAKGDLAWHKKRRRPLIAEADGESVHSLPVPVFKDRFRGNALVGQACDTLRFTFADSFRPAYIASTVRAALAA